MRQHQGEAPEEADDNHRRSGLVGSFDDYSRWEEDEIFVYSSHY